MYDEVFQAASERRQPNLAPQLAAIERGASQVAGVAALLGASSVDPRLMPLAAMMLPTPPVVRLVQPRLKALGSALLASVSTVAKVAWKPLPADNPKASAGSVALQSEASLAAGEHFRSAIVAEGLGVKASMDAVMAAHAVLVEACAGEACVQGLQGSGTLLQFPCRAPRLSSNDPPVRLRGGGGGGGGGVRLPARPPPPPPPPLAENLEIGRRPKVVAALRHRVQDALLAAQEARLGYVRAYPEQRCQIVGHVEGIPYELGDLVHFAWLSSLSLCLDELMALAAAVASAPAQRRDWLGSWLRAWRTTRAQL